MIVITGASGQLGGATVRRLLERVPAGEIGVSVRDPEAVPTLRSLGVRVRRGAYGDRDSLVHAFEGAAQVLLVSAAATGEAAVRLHRTAIEAAELAGVGRIVYTSHMAASPDSLFAPMPDHAATEDALRDSGVPFTSLRNGFYAASGAMLLGDALSSGVLAAPEDGPVSWTAHADLAEAAATVLTGGGFDGVSPALTGSEAIDLARVAEIASELTGREVRRVVVSDEEYRAGLLARGLPGSAADMLLGIFLAGRRGEFARVDPTLAELIGRTPTPFRDVLTPATAG